MEYVGWIVVQKEEGFTPSFQAQTRNNKERSPWTKNPSEAIEWLDEKVGRTVKLIETPVGAFRAYID